jgi:hypothetical protein
MTTSLNGHHSTLLSVRHVSGSGPRTMSNALFRGSYMVGIMPGLYDKLHKQLPDHCSDEIHFI